jgi:hypothetical protein
MPAQGSEFRVHSFCTVLIKFRCSSIFNNNEQLFRALSQGPGSFERGLAPMIEFLLTMPANGILHTYRTYSLGSGNKQ